MLALCLKIPVLQASNLIKERTGESPVPNTKLMFCMIACALGAFLHQKRKTTQYSNKFGEHCVKIKSAGFFTIGPLTAFNLPIITAIVSSPGYHLNPLCTSFHP